jgi:hypothetical protein
MPRKSIKAKGKFLKVLRKEEQISRRKRKREVNKRFRKQFNDNISSGCEFKKVNNEFETKS